MSIAVLEKKMQLLPEKYLDKIDHYIDFLVYEFQKERDDLQSFGTTCQQAQQWAQEVGLTQDELGQAIKENRREKWPS